MSFPNAAAKTNRVIHIILVAFLLIAFRVWHLGVIQREEKLREAELPKLRTILLRADRGTIYDRFHIPLATNRICYNAAIYYGQIAQIPIAAWKIDGEGRKVRTFPRKEHVKELARVLGELLALQPERIEDLIHAKASLLPHVPYILKTNLSESEYYRLKMLEKDWLGIHAEIASERCYPLGKAGCHIVGTLGSISQREYGAIAEEIAALREVVEALELGFESTLPPGYDSFDEVYARLYELKEKAYTLTDRVGKSGIEGKFEEELRGFWGTATFEVDQKGRALRELPGGKAPIPGREVVLSISSELQQFAEELLCKSEKERDGRSRGVDQVDNVRKVQKQPWIKGGAIVALDPVTGEILAMASYPRFDPNDFIIGNGKQAQISRWLENERFIAALWEGREMLVRERFAARKSEEEKAPLTWNFFLDQILPQESPLKNFFAKVDDVKSACSSQEDFETLLYFSPGVDPSSLFDTIPSKSPPNNQSDAAPYWRRIEALLGPLPKADRLYAIDLCRLAVCSLRFSDDLLAKVGSLKISAYWALGQALHRFEKKIKEEEFQRFHTSDFAAWRKDHQKEFLAQKRKEEKDHKTYARPYIDYLDREERCQFQASWKEHRLDIVMKRLSEPVADTDRELLHKAIEPLPQDLACEFLRTFRSFEELDRPLFSKKGRTEKDLASSFYPKGGFGFYRSHAFQASAPQGSVFKLVAAYEGLRQGHHFSLIDEFSASGKTQIVAHSLDKASYPRLYKGGRLPRSSASHIGKVDLIGAIECSSNPYFSILVGDYFKNPEDLNIAARLFGLGEKSGIELPGETAGHLPTDLRTNRTGLYSYAIGQHTLLTTPLQTALMLTAIANGGHLLKPKIVRQASGPSPVLDPFSHDNQFARKELDAIGIHFPLFTSTQARTPFHSSAKSNIEVRRSLPMPSSIRHTLLEAMDRSVWSGRGSARPAAIKTLLANPVWMNDYLSLQHQMIGKTSTSEILFNPNANPSSLPQLYKHISFGAISFNADPSAPAKMRWEHPELVVVVFHRFGDAGKETAPIAAQMIRKWREIKSRH